MTPFYRALFVGPILFLLSYAPVCVAKERPNILIVLTDDQGRDDFGYRNPYVYETPYLDRLRSQSLEFSRFYVNQTCAPTRASLLTGRHFLETGVWGVHGGQDYLNLDETTFAERLLELGYATAFYGKWHSGKTDGYLPWDRGFEEGELAHLYRHENGIFYTREGEVRTKGWTGRSLAEKASQYLRARSKAGDGRPFCLYLSMLAPHGPWYAPEERVTKYRKRGYSKSLAEFAGMIEELDGNIGRVLEALDESGLADDTVVLFFSDNGPIMNSGRKDMADHVGKDWELRNPSQLRGNKGTVYENGVRVPLFARWPGRIRAGESTQLSHVVDIFPTLLELAGERPDARKGDAPLRGHSLLPVMLHGAELPPRSLFIASDHAQVPGGRHRYDFLSSAKLLEGEVQDLALREGNRKLVRRGGRIELFDIENDPSELRDLSKVEPEVSERMSRQLLDTFESIRDSGRAFQAPVFRIGVDEDRASFVFACAPSELYGSVKYGSHATTGWARVGDGQAHRVDVVQEGWFSVILHVAGGKKGARVKIEVGKSSLVGDLTEGNRTKLGRIYLAKGDGVLSCVLKSLSADGGVFESLKAIEFIGDGATQGAFYSF
ncbi:sulfatase-like hydrolase/transferase [Pelagicoccus mobilis]|uniref:Sulfatase-like hydrolase/transferase n=1 Tax=Pelagicoccus mobilis TaxID=415221 RepID=A0A934S3H9_9BACT|nr:sulfatase-like hydrolase/transferase [Pelagicoccus mobilis]MBK1879117.1 sulfatase-like hydrolase/transferase [Pelagicoccus mobilis]